jgi:hypothetical protein
MSGMISVDQELIYLTWQLVYWEPKTADHLPDHFQARGRLRVFFVTLHDQLRLR